MNTLSNPNFINDDEFSITCKDGEAWKDLVEKCLDVTIGGATFRVDRWSSTKEEAYYKKVS